MIIILTVFCLFFAMTLSSIIVLYKKYPYYKKIYNELNKYEFITDDNLVYTKDFSFIWFVEYNDFKLSNGIYLHSNSVTYFDPYSFYWLIKYKRWFKNNCKHLV